MLSAQLTFRLEPLVEKSVFGFHHFEVLQRNVVRSLGFIVAIHFLQSVIEQGGEFIEPFRFVLKLYQPLMVALGIAIHIYRCRGIFRHFGARFGTCVSNTLFGIFHDQFFSKCVDEVFGATGDNKFIRIFAHETHRVAYQIAPKATRGCDKHGVVCARFYTPERHNGGVVAAQLVHRDKLVEHIIVYHEQHGLVFRIVLYAKKALTGVIGFHVVHLGRCDKLLVLPAIRGEGNAAVKKNLEVRPHFF